MILWEFLPELIFIFLLVTQVVRPLWRGTPLFPHVRGLLRGVARLLPKPTGSDRLLEASKRRLADAEQRRLAAKADADAARIEKEAEGLEEEADRVRMGDDSNNG